MSSAKGGGKGRYGVVDHTKMGRSKKGGGPWEEPKQILVNGLFLQKRARWEKP